MMKKKPVKNASPKGSAKGSHNPKTGNPKKRPADKQKSRPVHKAPPRSIAERIDDPDYEESIANRAQLDDAEQYSDDFVTSDDVIRNEEDRRRFVHKRNQELDEQMKSRSDEIASENSRTQKSYNTLVAVLVAILATMTIMFIAVKLISDGTLNRLFGIGAPAQTVLENEAAVSPVVTISFDPTTYDMLKELLGKKNNEAEAAGFAYDADGNPILDEEGNPIPLTENNGYLFMQSPDGTHTFMQSPDGLYVTIDGIPYKVVDTKDGLKVLNENNELVDIEGIDESYRSRIMINDDGELVYRIEWGDTLCKLSSVFNSTVEELAKENEIKNVNLIYAGHAMKLPDRFVTNGIDSNGDDIKHLEKLGGDSKFNDNDIESWTGDANVDAEIEAEVNRIRNSSNCREGHSGDALHDLALDLFNKEIGALPEITDSQIESDIEILKNERNIK